MSRIVADYSQTDSTDEMTDFQPVIVEVSDVAADDFVELHWEGPFGVEHYLQIPLADVLREALAMYGRRLP